VTTDFKSALLRVSLLAVVLAVLSHTRADPDLWGHVRFGHDTVAARALDAVDRYSFTSDRPWINHEWLAEIAMYASYAAAEGAGLVALKVALLLSMLGAVVVTFRGSGMTSRSRDLLVALALIGTVAQGNHVRPQLFSLTLFAWLLAAVVAATRGRPLLFVASAPLMAVWVNLHGGWIVGAGTLAVWAAVGLLTNAPSGEKRMALVGTGAAFAASLINPYGWHLWGFLRDTVGFGRENIIDWQPVYRLGGAYVLIWAAMFAAATAALISAVRSRRLDPRATAVVLMLAVASFRVNRLLAFFTISVVVLLGRELASLLESWRPTLARNPGRTTAVGSAMALAVAVAVIIGGATVSARNASCIRIEPSMFPEPSVAGLVAERGLHGRLLTWFDWGEYAIWHFAPALSVSIDGRRETVYSDAAIQRQFNFYFSPEDRSATIDALKPDYVWLPARLPVTDRLKADGWTPIFNGETSVLLARSHATTAGRPAPPNAERCFPGP